MYSDEWTLKGYKKSAKTQINDILNYYIWLDDKNDPKGITFNFEQVSDVHIEIRYENWMDFLSKELHLGQEMCSADPSDYLMNITWLELEERLEFHGIKYKKIHF